MLRTLLEMFLPEARFPDEKFWTKSGTSIRPSPKGPPRGTVGRTSAELGAADDVYPNLDSVRLEDPRALVALSDVIFAPPNRVTFLYDQHGNLHAQAPILGKWEPPWYAWTGSEWIEAPNFDSKSSETVEGVDAARNSADDGPMPSTLKLFGFSRDDGAGK